MSRSLPVTVALLAALAIAGPAAAQRGVGEAEGIVRQGLQPSTVTLIGVVDDVLIGPCHRTTGRAAVGAHALVRTGTQGPVNLHLGPEAALDALLDRLTVGTEVQVEAFRTDLMPPDAFVARTVTVAGDTFELRDDSLRPHWALGPGPGRGRDAAWAKAGMGRMRDSVVARASGPAGGRRLGLTRGLAPVTRAGRH